MSSHSNRDVEFLSTPQSSKKRKALAQTPEICKKKRKHEKRENGIASSQETATSKRDKKDKKKRKKSELQEIVEESPAAEAPDDIEITDAQDELDTLSQQIEPVEAPTVNGIDREDAEDTIESVDDNLLQSEEPTCFYKRRLSLQLPIPAISLATTKNSILSVHLAPLLLTYFSPAEGIILSFSEPVLSARPNDGVNLPLQPPKSGKIPRYPPGEAFARCADGYGVCWMWLTATFLVFKPQTGDELKGWTNVTSEGFIGLVSYNYFQTAVGKTRIPRSWTWDGPTREDSRNKRKTKIGRLRDEDSVNGSQEIIADSQETSYGNDFNEGSTGSFVDADGDIVSSTQAFKVVDVEMVPGHEKDKWTLQISGSLLSSDEEAVVVAEERQRFEQVHNRSRSRSKTPGFEPGEMPIMSGALPLGWIGSPS